MIKELMEFVESKLNTCKNKKKKIAIQGILTGITLACKVDDEKILKMIKNIFDDAVDEIIKEV